MLNQGIAGAGIGAPNPIPLWSYAVYLQNWWMAGTGAWGPGALGITWSLAVKEQFYLLLPVAFLLIPTKRIWILAVVCIWVASLLRWYEEWLPAYCLLTCRMDSLLTGVLIAHLLRIDAVAVSLHRHRAWVATSLLALCVALVALIRRPEIMGRFNHTFLALFYGAVLNAVVTGALRPLVAVLEFGWLKGIGRISYGIYLFHTTPIGTTHALLFRSAPAVHTLI